ncbi:MAG TPA: hypothetical protein VGP80_10860 [Gemmatimonadales bacterium]|jgi:hypothetical protein|nr:hypothetical protein [Gemmatimonadales bacterium]
MKAYWLKIGFGALTIFGVGMVLMGFGRRGVSRVREAIAGQSISLGANGAPFRLMGRQLGTLSRINLTPVARDGIPHIELTVKLDPGVSDAELANCQLVVNEEGAASNTDGLRCLDAAEEASGKFVEVGQVNLEPSGETLRLFVPQTTLDHNNWYPWFQGRSAPRATLAPRAPSASHPLVQLQADSNAAFLMIRDEHGKPVFQLNADSQGAFIQVRDSNGQEVLRFEANSKGVKGNIHSN